jgi:hypothetical protein
MRPIEIAGTVTGVILALLGLLWLLQGAGLLRMCPILCFANCECVTGGSRFWAIAGAVAFVVGAIAAGVSMRRGRS